MLKLYFVSAWRSIVKNRTTSLINIGGLSVGITAAVLILLWVQNELTYDNMHGRSGKIYRLTTSITEHNFTWESTPLLLADAAKKQVPEIDNIARLYTSKWPVVEHNNTSVYEKNAAYIDDAWFSMFSYSFIYGNAASFSGKPNSAVITESTAKRFFGNANAVGSVIKIDSNNYEISGVVKDAPTNSSFQFNLYLPISSLLSNPQVRANDENWDNYNYITFARLKPNSNTVATAKKITHLFPGNEKESTVISLLPLENMHFETGVSSGFAHGSKSTVYVFSLLAFILLLIACINYVNLTTAKASVRAKEVSIRKLVGAKRLQLFYQFIAESVLVSVISLVITLVFMQLSLPIFNSITNRHFTLMLSSASVWWLIGCTLLASLLLNSIYPAVLLSSFKPLQVFRGFTILKVKDSYLRKGLVVLQFAISVILISATIIIYQQMNFIRNKNPGYNRSQAITFALPQDIKWEQKTALVNRMKQKFAMLPGIEAITASNQSIVNMGSMSTGSADWDGHDTSFQPKITQLSADANFQQTLQLNMKEGRWFMPGSVADKNNVVLNETAISVLGIKQPVIGKRFTFKGRTGEVIGVVKDFNYQSMHDITGPVVAFNDEAWFNFLTVKIAAGKTSQALKQLQSTWNELVPGKPFEYSFLDDSFNALYSEDEKVSGLILTFAFIAVFISSLGLFGLATFTAERRIKEIGIRKVLGASISNVVTMLSGEFVKLVAVAILVATPLAYFAMSKWIENFAYRISISWWMFAVSGVLALLVALITTSTQAVKTALANPVKSLKSE